MKIAIIGANGFIAKDINRVLSNSNEVLPFSRESTNSDFSSLCDALDGVDIIIHAAFDNSYQSNLRLAKNLAKASKYRKVKKLIFFSSYVVTDLSIPTITEESPLSRSFDPYTLEKIRTEDILRKDLENSEVSLIILRPTIVFGLGGNWSRFAMNACHAQDVFLPKSGLTKCNYIYVRDISLIVEKIIHSTIEGINIFNLNGPEQNSSWKDFIEMHRSLAESSSDIHTQYKDLSTLKYSPRELIKKNIYDLWSNSRFVSFFLSNLYKIALRLKPISPKNSFEYTIKESYVVGGSSLATLSAEAIVSAAKMYRLLNLRSNFTLEDGVKDMKNV